MPAPRLINNLCFSTELYRLPPQCPGGYDAENDITWSDTDAGDVDVQPCPIGSIGKTNIQTSTQNDILQDAVPISFTSNK